MNCKEETFIDKNPILTREIEAAIGVINKALCQHGQDKIDAIATTYSPQDRFHQTRIVVMEVNEAQKHFGRVIDYFNTGPKHLRKTRENEDIAIRAHDHAAAEAVALQAEKSVL